MKKFEDWFATRVGHQDDEIWPGMLTFDPESGIWLDVVNFSGFDTLYGHSGLRGETITGYIDYQRPATLVNTFIQSANPGLSSVNTQIVRSRYRIVANGILKNIHLEDMSVRCFTGLQVQLPSLHAWLAPKLLNQTPKGPNGLEGLSLDIDEPVSRRLELSDGTVANLLSFVAVGAFEGYLSIRHNSTLDLEFPAPVDYKRAVTISSGLDLVFSFLLGCRLQVPVFSFPTIYNHRWNDADVQVVADLWFRPAHKRAENPPAEHYRMSVEEISEVKIDAILSLCLDSREDIRYLMDIVLAAENQDLRIDDCFVEILGCLEDFDQTYFGSGSDPSVRPLRRSIRQIVETHGSEEELQMCDRIGQTYRNAYSLRQRLDRLIHHWHSDGFRGNPDTSQFIKIRNLKPHGRGRELSTHTIREIGILLPFLCALARFHVLKVLGFGRNSIASSFIRASHRYGMFVPPDLVPGTK